MAMKSQLVGFKRAIKMRDDNDRAMVIAYNKAKHNLLGVYQELEGKPIIGLLTSTSGCTEKIVLHGAILGCQESDIRRRASTTVQIQAILCSIFTAILRARYGELGSPRWVIDAENMDIWADSSP